MLRTPPRWQGLVAAALLTGLLVQGCGERRAPGSDPPAPPRRGIVSMAPNLTETVFALGQGAQVVAVGDYDDYPPEVNALPRVGGYLDPDLEKITMLAPELILLPGKHQQVSEYAALNGLPVANVNMDSLAQIDAGIGAVGELIGVSSEANVLRRRMQADMEALRAATAGLPRPRVLVITSRQPRDLNQLYTTGSDSFVNETVTLAGGDNIYADATQRYLEASKETIVMKAPEVILEFHCGMALTPQDIEGLKADWSALPSLPAVQNGRIHIISDSHALRPGPRIVEVARMLARLLHPQAVLPA